MAGVTLQCIRNRNAISDRHIATIMDKPIHNCSQLQCRPLYTHMNYNPSDFILMHDFCLVQTGFLIAGGFVHTRHQNGTSPVPRKLQRLLLHDLQTEKCF